MEHNTRHPRTANELPKRSIHSARVLTAGHQERAAKYRGSSIRLVRKRREVDNAGTNVIIENNTILEARICLGLKIIKSKDLKQEEKIKGSFYFSSFRRLKVTEIIFRIIILNKIHDSKCWRLERTEVIVIIDILKVSLPSIENNKIEFLLI